MSAQKKTRRSMVSTSYMSMRKTQNFGKTDQFDNKNLSYAHIPMKKQTPDWNQSSATWRNSSPKYAFPKGSRFLTQKCSHLDIIQPEIPSTKSPVTCTFGKGNKRPISNIILRNAAQKPAPDRYDLTNQDQKSRSMEKGKSFGLGWKHYEKVYIDWRKDNYSFHFSNRNPPAIYNVRETPGKQAKKIAMHERLKMYTERMCQAKKHVPGPVHQIQDRHLSFMVGLNDRSFGFGERLDLAKPANDFPGAKYQIKGFTDIINKRNKYDQ